MAAMAVLRDCWNSGSKIPFYTRPQTEEECRAQSASIVANDAQISSSFDDAVKIVEN